MDLSANLSAIIGSGFATAVVWGIVLIVRAAMGRPLIQASAAGKISQHALNLIASAEKSADDAGKDAVEARREAADARREAADARRAAEDAVREVRFLKAAILSPYATLDGLRAMVTDGPSNGVGPRVPGSR